MSNHKKSDSFRLSSEQKTQADALLRAYASGDDKAATKLLMLAQKWAEVTTGRLAEQELGDIAQSGHAHELIKELANDTMNNILGARVGNWKEFNQRFQAAFRGSLKTAQRQFSAELNDAMQLAPLQDHATLNLPERHMEILQLRGALEKGFAVLSDKERQVVLERTTGSSLEEIAVDSNVTRERVRQLQDDGYKKMRKRLIMMPDASTTEAPARSWAEAVTPKALDGQEVPRGRQADTASYISLADVAKFRKVLNHELEKFYGLALEKKPGAVVYALGNDVYNALLKADLTTDPAARDMLRNAGDIPRKLIVEMRRYENGLMKKEIDKATQTVIEQAKDREGYYKPAASSPLTEARDTLKRIIRKYDDTYTDKHDYLPPAQKQALDVILTPEKVFGDLAIIEQPSFADNVKAGIDALRTRHDAHHSWGMMASVTNIVNAATQGRSI